jgi:hypothetical protein
MEQNLLQVLMDNGVRDETTQILVEDEVIERFLTSFSRGFIFPPKLNVFVSGKHNALKHV